MSRMPKLTVSGDGLARLQALAKELGRRPSVKIGVFGDDGIRRDGYSNVEVAVINEFREDVGPDGQGPARAPLRTTADAKKEEWFALMGKLLGKVTEEKLDLGDALELVGQRASADVRRTITTGAGLPPPNAPSTIAKKRSSRPLVDTAQLLNSYTYKIDKG